VRKRDLVDLVEALEQNIESLWRRHDEALVAVYGRIAALESKVSALESRSWGTRAVPAPAVEPPKQ
jgi:hypothetical protein